MPNTHGREPGESEYSWGKGLMPPTSRGYEPDNRDELLLTRQTETTNEAATWEGNMVPNPTTGRWEKGTWIPGNIKPESTPMVRETGPSSSSGQHAPIDPLIYNDGHYADGLQDGSGEEWRRNFPPNKVL